MHASTPSLSPLFDFKQSKKNALVIACASFFFIYIAQDLFMSLFHPNVYSSVHYALEIWVKAYAFVFISVVAFLMFLYWGLEGKRSNLYLLPELNTHFKQVRLSTALFVFVVFFLWSYVMLKFKVGMTIYADFEPLPYRLTGVLFYGRLFIQPVILGYIVSTYSHSRYRSVLLCLIILLGAWVALTSGSRFAAIMFSLPLVCFFHGKQKYIALFLMAFGGILIASASRVFYLPFHISQEYIQIYGNTHYQSQILENIYWLPINYIFTRMMGINEVLLTLNYGEITSNDTDAVLSLLSYFFRFSHESSVSVKNIYGFSDANFGGLGLDFFSNYWVIFGGNPLTYGVGLILIAWLLGKNYKMFATTLFRYGMSDSTVIVYILLFFLVFDGRGCLLLYMLPIAWLSSTHTVNVVFRAIRTTFTKYREV